MIVLGVVGVGQRFQERFVAGVPPTSSGVDLPPLPRTVIGLRLKPDWAAVGGRICRVVHWRRGACHAIADGGNPCSPLAGLYQPSM